MEMTTWVKDALENLWVSIQALSRNPLVDRLSLVEDQSDAYDRAMALVESILEAGQRLKANDDAAHFALLDRAYGLEGNTQRLYQLSAARPTRDELAAQAKLTVEEYEWELRAAITQLQATLSAATPTSEDTE